MPEISQEELDRLNAAATSVQNLEAKNREILEEKKKEKERADAAEAARMKETGDYKSLVEKMEAEKKADQEKLESEKKARLDEKKKNAFSSELDKLGIIPERKSFIMNSVNLEAVTYNEGANLVIGADAKAKEIQSQMPEIFGKKVDLPGQGNGSGGGSGSGDGGSAPAHMTDEWFSKLSVADQDKHRAEYLKSKGVTYRPRQN